MVKDFIIDGTGMIVRVGDRVVVAQQLLGQHAGPGVVTAILHEHSVVIRFDDMDEEVYVSCVRVSREDDTERLNGHPLWSWS